MLGRVLLMATTAVLVTFSWFVWRIGQDVPIEMVRTETFTLLAMCQWFNVLNCQSASRSALKLGLLKNPWLLGGLSVSVLLQVLVLYWPLMNTLFHTVPLAPAALLPLAALASCVLWAEELRKLALRLRHRRAA
jgi:Ca2+-transporting ATPase